MEANIALTERLADTVGARDEVTVDKGDVQAIGWPRAIMD
jgi:hypothetical protein